MKILQYLYKRCFKSFSNDLNIPSELKQEILKILELIDVSNLVPDNICDYIDFNSFSNRIENLNFDASSLSVVYIVKNEEAIIKKVFKAY